MTAVGWECWKVLPEKFARDETYSAADWIGRAFQLFGGGEEVEVSIWFSPQKAHFVRERRWYSSQRIEEQEDGSLILHMKTTGLVEVKNWVLTFGSGAEVLAPQSLRQDCISELTDMLKLYESKGRSS